MECGLWFIAKSRPSCLTSAEMQDRADLLKESSGVMNGDLNERAIKTVMSNLVR